MDLFDQEILGSELAVNGDFANWTGDDPDNWSVVSEDANNYITEHANGARLVSDLSAGVYMRQDFTTETNKFYKLTVTLTNYVSGDVRIKIYNTVHDFEEMGWTANGTYSTYFWANDTSIPIRFYRSALGATDLVYNNISVNLVVQPAKGEFTYPAILSNTESVVNGGFDSDTVWTKQAPWTIAGGVANCDGSQVSNKSIFQAIAQVDDKLYRCGFTILNRIGGKVRLNLNGTNSGTFKNSNDDHVEYIFQTTGTGNKNTAAQTDVNYNGDIDDFSVREVQISWIPYGTNTIEIDETNNQLKISYVNNDKGAFLDFSDANDLSADLTIGKTYLVTFDAYYDNDDGVNPKAAIYSNADAVLASTSLTTSQASYKLIFVATHATGDYIAFDDMSGSENVYIDNITIRELTEGLSMGMDMDMGIPVLLRRK